VEVTAVGMEAVAVTTRVEARVAAVEEVDPVRADLW
jgi:hypothetical protein